MEEVRFAELMRQERERLTHERDEIFSRQKELEDKLNEISRELSGIDAYAAAKTGKAATPTRQRRGPGKSKVPTRQSSAEIRPRTRVGGRRQALLQVIGGEPSGLSRGEIFERMAIKGDNSAEKSVSNALTALTKNNQVSRREGKYVIGG